MADEYPSEEAARFENDLSRKWHKVLGKRDYRPFGGSFRKQLAMFLATRRAGRRAGIGLAGQACRRRLAFAPGGQRQEAVCFK